MGQRTCSSIWMPGTRNSLSSLYFLWLLLAIGERQMGSTSTSRKCSFLGYHDARGAMAVRFEQAIPQFKGRVGLQQLPSNQLAKHHPLSQLPTHTWMAPSGQRPSTRRASQASHSTLTAKLWCATELTPASIHCPCPGDAARFPVQHRLPKQATPWENAGNG